MKHVVRMTVQGDAVIAAPVVWTHREIAPVFQQRPSPVCRVRPVSNIANFSKIHKSS